MLSGRNTLRSSTVISAISAGTSDVGLVPSPRISSFEKIPIKVYCDSKSAAVAVASKVEQLIREKVSQSPDSLFIMAAGADSALSGVYEELVRIHSEDKSFSFKNVHIFLTNEYYPLTPSMMSRQSLLKWLETYLIDYIDIPQG